MIEVDNSLELTNITTIIQDYLRVVETALGINSPVQTSALTSQKGETKTRVSIVAKTELPAKPKKELASLRSEALFRREEAKAIFVKNQAMFAISRTRFIHTLSERSK